MRGRRDLITVLLNKVDVVEAYVYIADAKFITSILTLIKGPGL